MDNRGRSIIKALTWRAIATLTTMTIVFMVTGSMELTFGAGLIDIVAKLIFYYFHERAWNKISWGRNLPA